MSVISANFWKSPSELILCDEPTLEGTEVFTDMGFLWGPILCFHLYLWPVIMCSCHEQPPAHVNQPVCLENKDTARIQKPLLLILQDKPFFFLFSLSPNPFLKPEWKLHRNERRDERLWSEPPGSLANSSPILCEPLPKRSPQNTNTREEPSGFKSLVHVSEGAGTGAILPRFSPGQSLHLEVRLHVLLIPSISQLTT